MMPLIWILLTVSGGGTVSTNNFPTEDACRDGASVALTGMTVAENAAADAAYEKAVKAEADRWRAEHPPRKPVTRAELKMVEESTDNGRVGALGMMGSSGPFTRVESDGLLYDYPGSLQVSGSYSEREGQWAESVRGSFRIKGKGDIKTAKCIGPVVAP